MSREFEKFIKNKGYKSKPVFGYPGVRVAVVGKKEFKHGRGIEAYGDVQKYGSGNSRSTNHLIRVSSKISPKRREEVIKHELTHIKLERSGIIKSLNKDRDIKEIARKNKDVVGAYRRDRSEEIATRLIDDARRSYKDRQTIAKKYPKLYGKLRRFI